MIRYFAIQEDIRHPYQTPGENIISNYKGDKIKFYLGDSGDVLSEILPTINLSLNNTDLQACVLCTDRQASG